MKSIIIASLVALAIAASPASFPGFAKKLFPELSDKTASRHVGCSQILKICPDKSLNGTQLAPTEWSCSTCSTVLKDILEVVQTPIQKINENAASFFCKKEGEGKCRKLFSAVITLVGPLKDIFENPVCSHCIQYNVYLQHLQSTINNVCKRMMQCVE
ncbi:hypothetical protein GCK72_023948 [Caenorhabditis remanei]|uniref:Saposin B-type domain-containing protein n=1 Tax=Caenorhabditis remanei TaxID=31234 RepID=A0A6A5FYE4_CAERE|nr:hypothetical protein GCK72_023948 [Caenorhabditis remanei]KAF1747484.1 hypothetical protein GCK72_023948 [Caenorhabditis remanei]